MKFSPVISFQGVFGFECAGGLRCVILQQLFYWLYTHMAFLFWFFRLNVTRLV